MTQTQAFEVIIEEFTKNPDTGEYSTGSSIGSESRITGQQHAMRVASIYLMGRMPMDKDDPGIYFYSVKIIKNGNPFYEYELKDSDYLSLELSDLIETGAVDDYERLPDEWRTIPDAS